MVQFPAEDSLYGEKKKRSPPDSWGEWDKILKKEAIKEYSNRELLKMVLTH